MNNALIKLIALCIMLNIFCMKNSNAQDVQIDLSYIQGIHYTENWDLFAGGVEFSAEYRHPIKELDYSAGIDFRTVQWGTQMTLSLGATKTLAERFEVGANIQNGMALFKQRKLYVIGGGIQGAYLFMKKESVQMGTSLEVRYTACPSYSDYSKIYSVTEIPIKLFIRF